MLRGRFQSRGGRGSNNRGRSQGRRRFGNSNRNSSSSNKEREMKFTVNSHSKPNSYTYATVKDHFIQTVQKTYRDSAGLVQSLKDGKKKDLTTETPTRVISNKTKPEEAAIEQGGFDIQYGEEYKQFIARRERLDQDFLKVYAYLLQNFCSRPMQARIEEHPDFETELDGDPCKTLEAIKTLMHDPVRAQYPLVSMTDALTRLLNMKQFSDETLLDYTKRFKQERDVAKAQLGTDILDSFVESSEEYKKASNAKQKTLKDVAFEKWMAYLFLRNADQAKYGSLMKGFQTQFSLNNDQYPKTIMTATDVLSNHKLDAKHFEKQQKQRNRSRPPPRREREEGNDNDDAASFAQSGEAKRCYCCGAVGHIAPNCSKRNQTPRSEWFCNRAIQNMMSRDDDDASIESNDASYDTATEDHDDARSTASRNRRSETQPGLATRMHTRFLLSGFLSHISKYYIIDIILHWF